MQDDYGLNKIILNDWGLTQSIDQQAAGLIMWVPCCLIYVTGAMYLLVDWFKQKEKTIAYSNKL
jgi:cytochrome c oxidase assembly factor CtaG